MEKTKLKCTKETKIVVDCNDLQDFIEEVYGQIYEIVAEEEWNNYESHNFTISKEDINSYDLPKLNFFKKGNPKQYSLRVILQDLCNQDFIEEGDYLINVYW